MSDAKPRYLLGLHLLGALRRNLVYSECYFHILRASSNLNMSLSGSRIGFAGVFLLLQSNKEIRITSHFSMLISSLLYLTTSKRIISLSLLKVYFLGSGRTFLEPLNRWVADSSCRFTRDCGGRGAIEVEMQLSDVEVRNVLKLCCWKWLNQIVMNISRT